jgi:hypothetical protein
VLALCLLVFERPSSSSAMNGTQARKFAPPVAIAAVVDEIVCVCVCACCACAWAVCLFRLKDALQDVTGTAQFNNQRSYTRCGSVPHKLQSVLT